MDFVCGSKCVCMKFGGRQIPWFIRFISMCWFKLQFWGIPLFSDTRIADWWCQIIVIQYVSHPRGGICSHVSTIEVGGAYFQKGWFQILVLLVGSQLWMTWVCSTMGYAPKSHSLGQMKWWVLDFVVADKFSMDKYLVTPSVLITTHEPNTQDPRDKLNKNKTCNFPRRRHLDPPGCWFPKWRALRAWQRPWHPLNSTWTLENGVWEIFSHGRKKDR
jgi:hypothetical protein